MLIFPLKKQWYEKIKSGEKTIEYREVKDYWSKRFYKEMLKRLKNIYGNRALVCVPDYNNFLKMLLEEDNCLFGDGTEQTQELWECKLRLGYTNQYMSADITRIEVINGKNTDLGINKPVYAIHLSNVKEIEKMKSCRSCRYDNNCTHRICGKELEYWQLKE